MKKVNSNMYYDEIKTGLADALDWAQGKHSTVTIRDVELPDPPRPITPRQITALRKKKVRVSQAVFAGIINASVQTVHAWEQGRGQPSGPALRLLRLLDKRPELIREFGRK
jgi:putative transcriptional regulator